jgi:antitoxin (DNA-binding transcriptional repressor) of toxin-antitoxin stability system
MKTISIRELHNSTGKLVRMASRHGEIRVTDRGRVVASIVAPPPETSAPYFSRRKSTAAFKRLDLSGKTGSGTDSTVIISEDRDDRA